MGDRQCWVAWFQVMARLRDKVLDWWLLLKRIIANGMCCLESFSLQHACPEQGVHIFDLSGRRANVSRHASLSAWKRPRSRHYLSRTSMSIVQPWSCEPKWRYVKVYYLDQFFQELNIYWYFFSASASSWAALRNAETCRQINLDRQKMPRCTRAYGMSILLDDLGKNALKGMNGMKGSKIN